MEEQLGGTSFQGGKKQEFSPGLSHASIHEPNDPLQLRYAVVDGGDVVGVLGVLENLLEEQGVLDQAGPRHVQEGPQVQLPGEGRLDTPLQEVTEGLVIRLLLVQESLRTRDQLF